MNHGFKFIIIIIVLTIYISHTFSSFYCVARLSNFSSHNFFLVSTLARSCHCSSVNYLVFRETTIQGTININNKMFFFPLIILEEFGLVEQQKTLNISHLRDFYAGDRFGQIIFINILAKYKLIN